MNPSLDSVLLGTSRAMAHLRAIITLAAPSGLAVLIEGPTGAGKELVAESLHRLSGRQGSFVAFNVCAVSDSMFEDALFGHARGAFTGALDARSGFLKEAHGGTVFLDEIGGLPLPLQAKLLRALETGRFRPVGGDRDVETDVRILAASNEPVQELVDAHRFRPDLAHRLRAAVIRVPALDERREDIPLLVYHFLRRAGRSDVIVTPGALNWLSERPWPGNVRELKQVVLWAATLCGGALTEHALVLASGRGYEGDRSYAPPVVARTTAQELRRLLERHAWDTARVALELRVSRATVYRWMKGVGVRPSARLAGSNSAGFLRIRENS